jgi:hypothetical protein
MAALYSTVKSKLDLFLKAIPRKCREESDNREERLLVANLLVNDEKFCVARQIQRRAPPPRITPGKNRRKIFIKILIIEMAIAPVRPSIRFAIGGVKRNPAGPLKPNSVQSIPLLIGSYDSCYRNGSLLRFV